MVMPSGAGHDAQDIARIAPTGMIYVPSVGGISHSPHEYTSPADITNGVNVWLRTVQASVSNTCVMSKLASRG